MHFEQHVAANLPCVLTRFSRCIKSEQQHAHLYLAEHPLPHALHATHRGSRERALTGAESRERRGTANGPQRESDASLQIDWARLLAQICCDRNGRRRRVIAAERQSDTHRLMMNAVSPLCIFCSREHEEHYARLPATATIGVCR